MKLPSFVIFLAAFGVLTLFPAQTEAQNLIRKRAAIPDISGYRTLQCDFHIHTLFSDGHVWPSYRVYEAYLEGLDAISITEHLRRGNNADYIIEGQNHPYDIATKTAEEYDVLVIRGGEISHSMPPGHANAIFLTDNDPVVKGRDKYWREEYAEAKKQNAFIFWNHPSWGSQQPDETRWWPEHTELYENGMMHGIEVVNGDSYSPEAHRWCIDRNLTMMGTSDTHIPIAAEYDFTRGAHRTMTLVFARERSPEAIREALDARRTAVWFDDVLIGDEALLGELFKQSIEIADVKREARRLTVTFKNNSDLTFRLKKSGHDPEIDYLRAYEMEIAPQASGTFVVRHPEGKRGSINFEVTNLWTSPGKGLEVSCEL